MNALAQLTKDDINTTINHEPRIMDLRLAEALGMADPHSIRRLIDRYVDALKSFAEIISDQDRKKGRGRPGRNYWLTKKQALFITAKSDTETAAMITIQMVEVFDEVTNGGRVIEAPKTNVVAIPTVQPAERLRPKAPSRAKEAVSWRKNIQIAQRHLAMFGEFYPVVVRYKADLASIFGEHDRVDPTRETLQLPTGALVVPIEGGGWRYEPSKYE